MTNAPPNTVLIVEDHLDVSATLQAVVQLVFKSATIVTADCVKDGLEKIQAQSFDLALIDLGLPDGSGIDIIKSLAQSQNTFIVVTTVFDDEDHLFQSLRSGASGYLLKGHQQAELVDFLQGILRGQPPLSPSIAHTILDHFHSSVVPIQQTQNTPDAPNLTDRESEVLQLIAKGCPVNEVANLLEIANGTVSAHVKKIYAKLDIHNRAEATIAAVNLNLVLP